MGLVSTGFGGPLAAVLDLDPTCGITSQEKRLVALCAVEQLACNLLEEIRSIQPSSLVDF
jgi:hypothetical protein